MEGLKDRPRSGKPSIIPKETMMEKIKQELSGSSTGWDFRQVIDIIQNRTDVSSTIKYTSTDYFTNGVLYQRHLRRGL